MPVSVATLPIGSSDDVAAGEAAGGEAGAGVVGRAGVGVGEGSGCACASRIGAATALVSSIVSETAQVSAGAPSTKLANKASTLANKASTHDDRRRAVPALDPPSRGVVHERCMSAIRLLKNTVLPIASEPARNVFAGIETVATECGMNITATKKPGRSPPGFLNDVEGSVLKA